MIPIICHLNDIWNAMFYIGLIWNNVIFLIWTNWRYCFNTCYMSFRYILNKIGPNMDPCGMPCSILVDMKYFYWHNLLVLCLLYLDCNRLWGTPRMLCLNILSRGSLWETQSKAKQNVHPLANNICHSQPRLLQRIVLQFFLKPYWLQWNVLLLSIIYVFIEPKFVPKKGRVCCNVFKTIINICLNLKMETNEHLLMNQIFSKSYGKCYSNIDYK